MWNNIANASAVVTLLGVIGGFASDALRSHIALMVFLLALLFITVRAYLALRAWQNRHYPKGYIPVATFIRYSTADERNIFYETFRHIQIKGAFKRSFAHSFFWTGTKPPSIKSSLQNVGAPKQKNDGEDTIVELGFRETRYYNDTEIVHVEMQLDDSDQASQTFLGARVDHPMRLIHFRVELLHFCKPAHMAQKAILERRLMTANSSAQFSVCASVDFDQVSKAYEYLLVYPEPGYFYRLRWDRVLGNGNAHKKK